MSTRSDNTQSSLSTIGSNHPYSQPEHVLQNFILIWLHENLDKSNRDYRNNISQLQCIDNNLYAFTDIDQCIDYLSEISDKKVFIIIPDALTKQIVPLIHDVFQLESIYIFCKNQSTHKEWIKHWFKIKGIYTDITQIYDALKQSTTEYDREFISVSFLSANAELNLNPDLLDPLFIYTQILKEILFEVDYNEQAVKDFVKYCREKNYGEPNAIDKFEREYQNYPPIWWYSREPFIYTMLNRALRIFETETIIKMGFFICCLHRNIKQLHQEQYDLNELTSFTVYRGQGVSKQHFEKLTKAKDGLISFNNFLSTSYNRNVSYAYACSNINNPDLVGVLFVITIDPSISSTPFAYIDDVSNFSHENEILFSMHTVFRIHEIKQIDSNNLFEVVLKLTSDYDRLLLTLTNRIREETQRVKGWYRLDELSPRTDQFARAEELYNTLLNKPSGHNEEAPCYDQLGAVKSQQKFLLQNNRLSASAYSNIGEAYLNMGDYSKALSFHQNALEIQRKTLPPNHPSLATSYNNIAAVYIDMGEYSKGLIYLEETLKIYQQTLPSDHPAFILHYHNLGDLYDKMDDSSKALSCVETTLQLLEKSLPPNDPLILTFYGNIAWMHITKSNYQKAIYFCQKVVEIYRKNGCPSRLSLVQIYKVLAYAFTDIKAYSEALGVYKKTLAVQEKCLPPNHLEIAYTYSQIAEVHGNTGAYWDAISYHKKALSIFKKIRPPIHSSLATCYNNIASVYNKMNHYTKAVSYYEKSIETSEKVVPPNHSNIAASYNNIGLVYINMGDNQKALESYEHALLILEHSESSDRSSILRLRQHIETLKATM